MTQTAKLMKLWIYYRIATDVAKTLRQAHLTADENYFEGYEQTQEERKISGERDIRGVLW